MDKIELSGTLPDGKRCSVWACGKCNMAARTEADAEACCKPYVCKCGATVTKRYWTACEECIRADQAAKDQAAYDAATKVKYADYKGEGFFLDGYEEYYGELVDLLDRHYDDDEAMPTWAWGATTHVFSMDAREIIESALEAAEWHEDAGDHVGDLSSLQAALDAAAKEVPNCYWQDFKTIVTFEEEAAEYKAEGDSHD